MEYTKSDINLKKVLEEVSFKDMLLELYRIEPSLRDNETEIIDYCICISDKSKSIKKSKFDIDKYVVAIDREVKIANMINCKTNEVISMNFTKEISLEQWLFCYIRKRDVQVYSEAQLLAYFILSMTYYGLCYDEDEKLELNRDLKKIIKRKKTSWFKDFIDRLL